MLTLLYAGIYVGHWIKIVRTHVDLDDIETSYLANPRKGFWVAVLTGAAPSKANNTDYTFITEEASSTEDRHNDTNYHKSLNPTKQTLIATLAVDIKACVNCESLSQRALSDNSFCGLLVSARSFGVFSKASFLKAKWARYALWVFSQR